MPAPASRQGALGSRGARPSSIARRKSYPDLSPKVNLSPDPVPAESWPAWTDRFAVQADVPVEEWPAWTRTRFTTSLTASELGAAIMAVHTGPQSLLPLVYEGGDQ